MKRLFAQFTAAALLLATALPVSAWAGAAFNKTLKLQGISFQVQSSGEGSQQQLTITTSGAEVAELNSNGLPEIDVFVQGAGSGSYGELVGYAVIAGEASWILRPTSVLKF
ncbi:MAG: hypothetical protein WCH37_06015 [Synechococcaceae cyanobacterium ELA182]